jgi:hypothetical protein
MATAADGCFDAADVFAAWYETAMSVSPVHMTVAECYKFCQFGLQAAAMFPIPPSHMR